MASEQNIIEDVLVVNIDEKENVFAEYDDKKIMQTIDNLTVRACDKIAFDLSKKEYFDSSDLGGLIKINDMLIDENIEVFIVNPSQAVQELFELVGMSDFFNIVGDHKELSTKLLPSE